jgi:heat shock protein HtpX
MLGNWFKTTLLMAAIVVLFGLVGAAIGGMNGMMMALLIAAGMNFYAYWFSADMVLRMYNAQEITADNRQFSAFYHMVKELAQNAQLPMPKVYVIDEAQPNAFATGRNPENAAVAATTGIMQILNQNELRGVMAHELAHVKHRDTLISTISATIAGAISSIGSFGMLFAGGNRERGGHPLVAILVLILAPIAAMLIQMAISRAREFEADKGGAEISRDPASLASALKKIHNYAHQIPMETAEMHPETAQMMIINPLSAEGVQGLFSTHPQTEERIARLMAMVR